MVHFPFSKIKTYLLMVIQIHNSIEYHETASFTNIVKSAS